MCIFIDCTILNNIFSAFPNFLYLAKPAAQKVHLKGKTPLAHIRIKIFQIGILIYIFELGQPAIMFGEHGGERCFSSANISCNRNMHNEKNLKNRELMQTETAMIKLFLFEQVKINVVSSDFKICR